MRSLLTVILILMPVILSAVEEGQIISPDTVQQEVQQPVTVTPTDVVKQEPLPNGTVIACEKDPREFMLTFPENAKIGKVRLSSGIEPVKSGFFSYAFSYDFTKQPKGALYLSMSAELPDFTAIAIPVFADGSKNELRVRLIDKDGEVFTTILGTVVLNWKDSWKIVSLKQSDFEFTDWAETNTANKKMDFPVVLQKIYVVNLNDGLLAGTLYIDDIVIQ